MEALKYTISFCHFSSLASEKLLPNPDDSSSSSKGKEKRFAFPLLLIFIELRNTQAIKTCHFGHDFAAIAAQCSMLSVCVCICDGKGLRSLWKIL